MKHKGFTLIELLAVIVILAVIALITTPVITGIVEASRRSAFESTTYGVIDSAKMYYASLVGEEPTDMSFDCVDTTCTSDGGNTLPFNGNINGSGSLLLFQDGAIAICLNNGKYTSLKNVKDTKLTTTSGADCEFNEETKEYANVELISETKYNELKEQYDNLVVNYNDLTTELNNGKEVISSAITDKGVETTIDNTFEEMATNIGNISSKITSITSVSNSSYTMTAAQYGVRTLSYTVTTDGDYLVSSRTTCNMGNNMSVNGTIVDRGAAAHTYSIFQHFNAGDVITFTFQGNSGSGQTFSSSMVIYRITMT